MTDLSLFQLPTSNVGSNYPIPPRDTRIWVTRLAVAGAMIHLGVGAGEVRGFCSRSVCRLTVAWRIHGAALPRRGRELVDQLVGSFVAENVLSLVVLILGSDASVDLVARLAECVSIVTIARATDEHEARKALSVTSPDVAIIEMSTLWADSLFKAAAASPAIGQGGVRTLALGETGAESERRRSQSLSAHGYLHPTCDPAELRSLLVRTTAVDRPAAAVVDAGVVRTLTRREAAVVELIAEGYSNRQIADSLSISEATVKNHVHNLLGKLRVKNRVQAGVAWSSGAVQR